MVRAKHKKSIMINASDPSSFPTELKSIVSAHISLIPEQELQRIKKIRIEYKGDVLCAIESYLSPAAACRMYCEELIPIFNSYDLLCYHATRVGSTETILKKGIFADFEQYKKYLIEFLQNEEVSAEKINQSIELIQAEYHRKYSTSYQICFFTNLSSLYSDDGSAAYDQFCETVGGELANWGLEEKMQDVLNVLQTKGVPLVVEFKTPFSKISPCSQEKIIYGFVLATAAKILWDYEYKIEVDGALIGNVPQSNILKTIEQPKKSY